MEYVILLFVFLVTLVFSVLVSKWTKIGPILLYLIAGIALGLIAGLEGEYVHFSLKDNNELVMEIAEYGVIMMLFLIGLEMKPSKLWKLKTLIFGTGSLQMFSATACIAGLAYFTITDNYIVDIAIGLIFAMSSTAVAIQLLNDNRLLDSEGGQLSFTVLLFQDISVIPILVLLPILANMSGLEPAVVEGVHEGGHASYNLLEGQPNWVVVLGMTSAIALIVAAGKFLSTPVFRLIASTRSREAFFGFIIAVVMGISALMTMVGLSASLGAFLGGVVLADSEFRAEIESEIEHIKGILMGIFFIAIGLSVNIETVIEDVGTILLFATAFVAFKLISAFGIGYLFKLNTSNKLVFSIALSQGGEFAFVLLNFGEGLGLFNAEMLADLMAAVVISMMSTPVLFIFYKSYVKGLSDKSAAESANAEPAGGHGGGGHGGHGDEESAADLIIAGYGRLGVDVGRMASFSKIKTTVIDNDEATIAIAQQFGFNILYGDATRPKLLEAAGAHSAKVLVIAIRDADDITRLVQVAKANFPNLYVITKATTLLHYQELLQFAPDQIVLEKLPAAMRMSENALSQFGLTHYEAKRAVTSFRIALAEQFHAVMTTNTEEQSGGYMSEFKQNQALLMNMLKQDEQSEFEAFDSTWIYNEVDNPYADEDIGDYDDDRR